jgi:hypothetical protein
MTSEAVIIVVLFAIGVSRAWELVGAHAPKVAAALREIGAERAHPAHESDDEPAR